MSLSPGFTDPVLGAQSCFRAVLEAMSRPGRVFALDLDLEPPAGVSAAAAALLLTLADAETPLWLDAGDGATEWARFHCGSPVVATADQAQILLATGTPPRLSGLELGSDEAPQDGATLIIQVQSLEAGSGWRLTGPGIEREHRLRVVGLPADFAAARAKLAKEFPRGVDIVLCAGSAIAALPRTTRIEEG